MQPSHLSRTTHPIFRAALHQGDFKAPCKERGHYVFRCLLMKNQFAYRIWGATRRFHRVQNAVGVTHHNKAVFGRCCSLWFKIGFFYCTTNSRYLNAAASPLCRIDCLAMALLSTSLLPQISTFFLARVRPV
jgi:hypothetical protein